MNYLERTFVLLLALGLIWVYTQIPEPNLGLITATTSKCVKVSGSDGSETHISIIKGRIIYSEPGSTTPDCL